MAEMHVKSASEIRAEATKIARVAADERLKCGDPEGAAEMQNIALSISRIKLMRAPKSEG